MTLVFAEVPGFYAEWERAADPGLATRPVIVGGDPRKKGLVQSATPDALARGVRVGMPIALALSRCPGARARRTNMRAYREAAGQLRACFRRFAERVEPAGLEAAFLEAQGSDDPLEVGRSLQREVRTALRLPLRVGIAPVKFVARLAAEESGAEGIRRVEAHEIRSFLGPLEVGRLPGVGERTAAALAELGARTVAALAALPEARVEERLGNHGLTILAAARGQGEARVRAGPHRRSLGQELTLERGEVDLGALHARLHDLAADVERGLARERLAARRVILKVRYEGQETVTRSRTLERPVHGAPELQGVAAELLGRTQAGARPIRLLGLSATDLHPVPSDDRQLSLFGP